MPVVARFVVDAAAGGLMGGLVSAVLVLAVRPRRRTRPDNIDDVNPSDLDAEIDAAAQSFARDSGRPWAAGLVADKLRLAARLGRSRDNFERRQRR